MRERLIELLNKKYDHFCDQCGVNKDSYYVDNLADYILADGWIRLPCKVGDVCYPLNASETSLTCEEKISRITISEKNIIIGYYEHWDYYKECRKTDTWRLPLRTRILGKTVFLSREDAEKALKGGAE